MFTPPSSRAEVSVLCIISLGLGMAIGLYLGAIPTAPAPAQFDAAVGLTFGAMAGLVAFSIHRANKEWKFKTTRSSPSDAR